MNQNWKGYEIMNKMYELMEIWIFTLYVETLNFYFFLGGGGGLNTYGLSETLLFKTLPSFFFIFVLFFDFSADEFEFKQIYW